MYDINELDPCWSKKWVWWMIPDIFTFHGPKLEHSHCHCLWKITFLLNCQDTDARPHKNTSFLLDNTTINQRYPLYYQNKMHNITKSNRGTHLRSCIDAAYEMENPPPKKAEYKVQDSSILIAEILGDTSTSIPGETCSFLSSSPSWLKPGFPSSTWQLHIYYKMACKNSLPCR